MHGQQNVKIPNIVRINVHYADSYNALFSKEINFRRYLLLPYV